MKPVSVFGLWFHVLWVTSLPSAPAWPARCSAHNLRRGLPLVLVATLLVLIVLIVILIVVILIVVTVSACIDTRFFFSIIPLSVPLNSRHPYLHTHRRPLDSLNFTTRVVLTGTPTIRQDRDIEAVHRPYVWARVFIDEETKERLSAHTDMHTHTHIHICT
jgi:hypothetical protein